MPYYMRVDGVTPKQTATVEKIGGKDNLFPISSVQYGGGRSIYVEVGSSGSADVSQVSISELTVTRTTDGASAALQTLLFAPSAAAKTMEIIVPTMDRDGKGLIPQQLITLEEARISSYSASGGGEGPTSESVSVSFTSIAIAHYTQDTSGEVKKGDTVKFDLKTGKLVSQASV